MMGYSHTVSAAAGWLALNHLGVVSVADTPSLVVTTLACAGSGMLPDIDHKNGSIAHSIPPISGWISGIVAAISGGHRKGTHSILGVLVFWAVAIGAQKLTYEGIPWVSIFLAAYTGGLALRVLGAPGGWLGAVGLGYFAWVTDSLAVLPLAIGVGATVHIMGDLLTARGVNPLWPLTLKPAFASRLWRKSGYMALPILGDAGSRREKALCLLLCGYILFVSVEILGFAPPLTA